MSVVDHISFSIFRGELCGILGPNGAGKTTTLKMLVGNVPPTSGPLRVLGFSISARARQMRRRIGIVPQVDNLDPDFTVIENLMVYGQYFGLKRAEINARIPFLLSLAALENKAHYRINQLSGGMRRRLSIARALINRQELLILDEPATELDPQIRQNIWQMSRQLQKDGLTIVPTTHYMDEAERLCSRIILMDHGQIRTDQTPVASLKNRTKSVGSLWRRCFLVASQPAVAGGHPFRASRGNFFLLRRKSGGFGSLFGRKSRHTLFRSPIKFGRCVSEADREGVTR
ncbi:ABC transporter ATP-binding protein [Methylocaldum gracile]